MSAPTISPDQFTGKKVLLTLDGEPFEATIEEATSAGVIYKRKGKAQIELCAAEEITAITLQESAEPVIKARRLDPVSVDNIKRHLVDRHGYAVADINQMASTDAFEFHENIIHGPLGHFHEVKKDKTEE